MSCVRQDAALSVVILEDMEEGSPFQRLLRQQKPQLRSNQSGQEGSGIVAACNPDMEP